MRLRELLAFMAELDERTGYPVPAPKGFASAWSKDLELPRGPSRRLLFTGALYQLTPYIPSLVELLRLIEYPTNSSWALLRVARDLSRTIDLSSVPLLRPDGELLRWSNAVLRTAVRLLLRAGVDFMYVPEVSDLYSGAILRDYGLVEAFRKHAKAVLDAVRSTGAEEVIVLDPHTQDTVTNGFREALGEGLRAVNYMDLVKPAGAGHGTAVVHDSCVYARRLGIIDRPRELLRLAGYNVVEPRRSREWTYCCGGPLEALLPSLSSAIADARAKELASLGDRVVTFCPICYLNLRRALHRIGSKARVYDLLELIGGGLER